MTVYICGYHQHHRHDHLRFNRCFRFLLLKIIHISNNIHNRTVIHIFMAALLNRAGHYIFALWFLLSFFFFFSFPRLISAVAEWMSTVWRIGSGVWGNPANFNGFHVLAALLHGTLVVGVIQTAALDRGRHLYATGRPSRWALDHI